MLHYSRIKQMLAAIALVDIAVSKLPKSVNKAFSQKEIMLVKYGAYHVKLIAIIVVTTSPKMW